MVVRFMTRRFIGEYDPNERSYSYCTTVDNEIVNFELLDCAGPWVVAAFKSTAKRH